MRLLTKLFKRFMRMPNVYYCNALHGDSNYNICINCDMTVSCNCQDYDGSAHIGDLQIQSFEEIFRGEKAQEFREMLSRGKYPVSACKRCPELRTTHKEDVYKYLYHFELPHKAIMVENTVLCNLSCLFCSRTKTQNIRRQNRMSLADIERVALLLKEYHIEAICFHNLGEPFISNTIPDELSMLIRYNPDLKIFLSTNGALIDTGEKVEATLILEHIFFSIDGPNQEIMTKYQVGGDFEKAYANLKRVVAARNAKGQTKPTIEWKYVVFNWNDSEEHIEEAIKLANQAGVDLISFTQGGAPAKFSSRRYLESPYFQTLGEPSWRGREIWLNGQ